MTQLEFTHCGTGVPGIDCLNDLLGTRLFFDSPCLEISISPLRFQIRDCLYCLSFLQVCLLACLSVTSFFDNVSLPDWSANVGSLVPLDIAALVSFPGINSVGLALGCPNGKDISETF